MEIIKYILHIYILQVRLLLVLKTGNDNRASLFPQPSLISYYSSITYCFLCAAGIEMVPHLSSGGLL